MTADTGNSRELRDRLAEVLHRRSRAGGEWSHMTDRWQEPWLAEADAVLALPEVAALIGLREQLARVEILLRDAERYDLDDARSRVSRVNLRAALDAPASPTREGTT